jgi:hypothetical protein
VGLLWTLALDLGSGGVHWPWAVLRIFSLSDVRMNTLNAFHMLFLFEMTSSEGGKGFLFRRHASMRRAL